MRLQDNEMTDTTYANMCKTLDKVVPVVERFNYQTIKLPDKYKIEFKKRVRYDATKV